MNFINHNFLNIGDNYKKYMIIIFTLTCFFNSNIILAQKKDTIFDFYEYANKEWLDNTIIPEKVCVVNNWGILWEEIIEKSIEILSDKVQYELDENNQYILIQLQNFYKSAAENIPNERKRVYLVQKHYPIIFGVIFSKITIPKEKEEKIKELIKYLALTFRQKIENSNHIEEKNIDFFLSILEDMKFEIGAPDISHLPKIPELSTNSLETNIELTEEYQAIINTEKPYWESPPFETDCRYNYNENKVKIYAGTLYASNFSNENGAAEVFATIGRTIAHEMTHAFDKLGKKFIKKDWENINTSLINQFNKYSIQENYIVDGKTTLQENFADLGGVEVSLLALQLFLKDKFPQYSEKEKLDVIRNYFLAYVAFWREKVTPEFALLGLTRSHTPQKFRAIGPIYNQNEFYDVFKIDIKSIYYIPENLRICIW
ncbi:MAG: hypothetical protein KKA81_11235 [Bacteroidetes bacterium]|nr:hypothetical protein [Bacteroidota bacterium]